MKILWVVDRSSRYIRIIKTNFFNRLCNPSGFWPAQLSLNILSRKVSYRMPLPAARQTPQTGGPVIRKFQLPPPGVPHANENQLGALFILSLFRQSTSIFFGHICSQSSN